MAESREETVDHPVLVGLLQSNVDFVGRPSSANEGRHSCCAKLVPQAQDSLSVARDYPPKKQISLPNPASTTEIRFGGSAFT